MQFKKKMYKVYEFRKKVLWREVLGHLPQDHGIITRYSHIQMLLYAMNNVTIAKVVLVLVELIFFD